MTTPNPSSGLRPWIPSSQNSLAANRLWNRFCPVVPRPDPEKRKNNRASYFLDITLAGLKRLRERRKLCCNGPARALGDPKQFAKLLRRLPLPHWVLSAKATFSGP